MSSAFDAMQRIFVSRFQPISGDELEKHLFQLVIEEIHSFSHQNGDALNRGQISKAVRTLEKYIQDKQYP